MRAQAYILLARPTVFHLARLAQFDRGGAVVILFQGQVLAGHRRRPFDVADQRGVDLGVADPLHLQLLNPLLVQQAQSLGGRQHQAAHHRGRFALLWIVPAPGNIRR